MGGIGTRLVNGLCGSGARLLGKQKAIPVDRSSSRIGSQAGTVLVLCEGDCFDGAPLCTFLPSPNSSNFASEWVLKKVEKIQACLGITCDGFEEQLKTLLLAIEYGHSSALKFASKRDMEL